MRKRKIALVLAMVLAVTTCACTSNQNEESQKQNLMNNIEAQEVELLDEKDLKSINERVTDFAVRLFQKSLELQENKGEDLSVSPLSVLCALAMTANGAKNETFSQMEEVFGISIEELNNYFNTYMEKLPENEAYKLSLANSIWFAEDETFKVNEEFLQLNSNYYDAGLYQVPMNAETVKEINNWVKENTDNMIPEIIDELDEGSVMCLVNALAFDAQWQDVYVEEQIRDGIFTLENGTEQEVTFMDSEENYYLKDENATGFIKYYKDKAYAFVALLPNEGVSVAEYVQTLTGEHLNEMLSHPERAVVGVSIPKFESEYSLNMSDILISMGIVDAFDSEKADFSNLGTSQLGDPFISRVLHKTFISVAEQGTKAGAATAVIVTTERAMERDEVKMVYLNRPFVYLLMDCETNQPFFIGTMMNVEE